MEIIKLLETLINADGFIDNKGEAHRFYKEDKDNLQKIMFIVGERYKKIERKKYKYKGGK